MKIREIPPILPKIKIPKRTIDRYEQINHTTRDETLEKRFEENG